MSTTRAAHHTTEIYENLKYKNKKQAKRKQTERNTKKKKLKTH